MSEFDEALEALKMHLGQDTQRSNVAPGVTWNPDTGRYEGNVTPQQQASTYERKRDRLDMPKWRMPSLPYALTDPNRGAPLGEQPLDAASNYYAGGLPRDNRPDNRTLGDIAGNAAAYAGGQFGLGAATQFMSPLLGIPPGQAAANRARWDQGVSNFAEDYPGVHAGVRAAGDVAMASGMPEGFGAMPVAMTQRVGGLSDAAGRAVQDAPNSAGVFVVPKAGAGLANTMTAARLRMQGSDNSQVWKQTGLAFGEEGLPLKEIPDTGMKVDLRNFGPGDRRLAGEIINHPKLYEEYPELQDILVRGTENVSRSANRPDVTWKAGTDEFGISTIDKGPEAQTFIKGQLAKRFQQYIGRQEGQAAGAWHTPGLNENALNSVLRRSEDLLKNTSNPMDVAALGSYTDNLRNIKLTLTNMERYQQTPQLHPYLGRWMSRHGIEGKTLTDAQMSQAKADYLYDNSAGVNRGYLANTRQRYAQAGQDNPFAQRQYGKTVYRDPRSPIVLPQPAQQGASLSGLMDFARNAYQFGYLRPKE